MNYPIEDKLVIAVASSALFDLAESGRVFDEQGEAAYRRYQQEHGDVVLKKGVAFPFIRRFLSLNKIFPAELPVEVVLLSKNDPETGLRAFRSIEHYGLDISRAAFRGGKTSYEFMPSFNVSLFLSANSKDVASAIAAGFPAGTVMPSNVVDDEDDHELRVAFDFDGVIADDESESVYKNNDLGAFVNHEVEHASVPHNPGPLNDFFKKLSALQQLELAKELKDKSYRRTLRIALVTARSAPAHERVVTTLKGLGVSPDDTFFLGGMEKGRVLDVLKPHIFFDDQISHLKSSGGIVPMVHIPFGIANK